MPSYRHLLEERLNYNEIEPRVRAAQFLGAKYDFELSQSADVARKQAEKVAAEIVAQSGQVEYNGHLIKDSTAIALIAYMQRLGTDLFKPEESPATPNAPAPTEPEVTATAEVAHSLPETGPR